MIVMTNDHRALIESVRAEHQPFTTENRMFKLCQLELEEWPCLAARLANALEGEKQRAELAREQAAAAREQLAVLETAFEALCRVDAEVIDADGTLKIAQPEKLLAAIKTILDLMKGRTRLLSATRREDERS